jgi:cytosine/adenosine deaminase-related metal-dependent hydrolase
MNARETLHGYVNAHTHLYSGLAQLGMPVPERPPVSFLDILRGIWWRLDRALDESALRAAARLHVAEALLHGTTALVDHHESPGMIEGSLDILADACQELGIRALLCYGATERNGGRPEAQRGIAESVRFARDNRRALVRGLVGLHASFTVSDETILEAAEACRAAGTALHVHMAEDLADVRDAQGRGYRGPLERLVALDALPPRSILAHGVHLDAAQARRAETIGCWVVQNPRSNEGNRVGYPRGLWASRRVALGTDGHGPDMPAELAALRRIAGMQRGAERCDSTALARRLAAGADLIAEWFGAEAVARDRVVLESEHEDLPAWPRGMSAGRAAAGVAEVRATTAASVTIAGRAVVRDGRLLTADFEAIRAEALEHARRLWTRMQALP